MDDAFLVVVIGVSLLAFVAAIVVLATSGGAYDRIGEGGLEDRSAPDDEVEDLRQLLAAQSARRVARGEPPLDVEAEVSKRLREM